MGRIVQGRWRIDAKLGQGSTADVYAATNVVDGRRAALKILRAHVDEATRRRFKREGFVANAVGHPGVVSVFDHGVTEGGSLFIVMELLDGQSLETLREVHGGVLPVRQVVDIGCELLEILAASHARSVIHRDLKPANVFLTADGKLKVLDFGLAYVSEPDRNSSITKAGVAMGTLAFMPPEQARGRHSEVDARSDLWALGATLFTLLTGRPVHVASSSPAQLLAVITKPAPLLQSVAPDVPRAVATVIDRALAFERDARWGDADAMCQALSWTRLSTPELAPPTSTSRVNQRFAGLDGPTPVDLGAASRVPTPAAAFAPTTEPMAFAPRAAVVPPLPSPPFPPISDRVGTNDSLLVEASLPAVPAAPAPRWHTLAAGLVSGVVAGGLALAVIFAAHRVRHTAAPRAVLVSSASAAAPLAPPPPVESVALSTAPPSEPVAPVTPAIAAAAAGGSPAPKASTASRSATPKGGTAQVARRPATTTTTTTASAESVPAPADAPAVAAVAATAERAVPYEAPASDPPAE